ncbi:EF-P 5-aminopentanol modification-associated protein YfmH [Alkaliphilus hydrothermalis]|uniref:Zn-dependent peptidase n=1 Tax=Alkaliphilus hydrothermalis TaxID=1482730 RepID=A0ABS2NNW2_9FIRM|nr:pitrilysin family protein [Alkaliphilus hydrothermalis]MBM7614599.1 putative Zn-dependent peptidase [Alkaliphilus hydrothermalis]
MTYDQINGELVKEIIYRKKLDNGLEVFFLPKEGYAKQYASFSTKFGSNDLKFSKNGQDMVEVSEGIAHFLEHKLFEEPEGNAFDRFAALGANVNAFTNFNITAYYFTSTDYFYENLQHLIDFVQNPYFTDENVEKEKGIIGQEIKMYQDNPQWKVFFNFLKGMYREHPVKNDIAGTVESITATTKEDLYSCYETFYHPSNMVLFIAGDLDKEKVFEAVEESFHSKEVKEIVKIQKSMPIEPPEISEALVEEKLSVSTPLFNLGYKDTLVGMRGMELLKKEVTMRLLLDIIFGKSSPLFEKLYDEGLVDPSFNADFISEVDYGHSIISGQSTDPKLVKNYINEHISQLKETGVQRDEFERIKRKQIGDNLSFFNSIEYTGNSFVSYYFKDINYLEYIEVLKSITLEEVQSFLRKHFDESKQVLSIIKP